MTTTQTPTTTPSTIRSGNRSLSRNQLANRGLGTNHAEQYAAEVLRIATKTAAKHVRNDSDRDELASRVLSQFFRHTAEYMTRYPFPAQFVSATLGSRFQDFLRDERRQSGLGASMITRKDGSRTTARKRVALQIEVDGELVDRPISDGVDAYAAADVRVDIERVADRIDPKFLQTIQDAVIDDEKAVVIAKREGVAHTTIAHRVKRGQQEFAKLLGDDYELGAR